MTIQPQQATLMLLLKDNQILLAMKKRGLGVGKWNGIGGKKNVDETIEQTAVRETQEEIGVTPKDFQQMAILNFHGGSIEMQGFVYICKSWEGEPTETEEMRPQWFDLDKIPYDEMWPDDRTWLPLVLEGKHVVAEIDFDKDNNMLSCEVV